MSALVSAGRGEGVSVSVIASPALAAYGVSARASYQAPVQCQLSATSSLRSAANAASARTRRRSEALKQPLALDLCGLVAGSL